MSELNSVLLNSATLGSGGATTGYGGNVVSFSGSITFEVVFSLNNGGVKQRKFSLVSPLRLNAFVGEKRFTKVQFALYGVPKVSGSLRNRVVSKVSPDGPTIMLLSGVFSPRVRRLYRIDAPLVLSLVASNYGTDLSRTPAPLERRSLVAASNRISYAQRG